MNHLVHALVIAPFVLAGAFPPPQPRPRARLVLPLF